MRRLNTERGAVAVIVAILATVLLGFAALGVDVAQMHAEKQKLQNGADAGALAIAQACAAGDCETPEGKLSAFEQADEFAGLNNGNLDVAGSVYDYDLTDGWVTVLTTAPANHSFASVIGFDSTPIDAMATAEWGSYSSASSFPLTLSYCELEQQGGVTMVDGEVVQISEGELPVFFAWVENNSSGSTNNNECPEVGPAEDMPGGFGWLVADNCLATTNDGAWFNAETGKPSKDCDLDDFELRLGQIINVPIYSKMVTPQSTYENDSPYSRAFYILGYAAIRLDGIKLQGNKEVSIDTLTWPMPLCSPSNMCLAGRFVEFVSLDDAVDVDPNAGNYGSMVVRLTMDPD